MHESATYWTVLRSPKCLRGQALDILNRRCPLYKICNLRPPAVPPRQPQHRHHSSDPILPEAPTPRILHTGHIVPVPGLTCAHPSSPSLPRLLACYLSVETKHQKIAPLSYLKASHNIARRPLQRFRVGDEPFSSIRPCAAVSRVSQLTPTSLRPESFFTNQLFGSIRKLVG